MDLDVERLTNLMKADLPVSQIARDLGVSRQTVYRHMKRNNLSTDRFSDISDQDLITSLLKIKELHSNDGVQVIAGHLREEGIRVPRSRLRKIIHEIDPEGVKERRKKAVKRRVYSVPCPHFLWHLDGNHKLIKWKLVIHGCVDGFTRLITFLQVSDNNRASTVQQAFCGGVDEFGWPLHIRTDHGGENQRVWEIMKVHRGRRSVKVGSSVHNERIERLWREVNTKVTWQFKELFQGLFEDEENDPDNETDILCLHWVFIPLIQKALTQFAKAHNQHGICTEGGMSPLQLDVLHKPLREEREQQHHNSEDSDTCTNEIDGGALFLDNIPLPLPHVPCSVQEEFSDELIRQLQQLGRAQTIAQGYSLYQDVCVTVSAYLEQHGHL